MCRHISKAAGAAEAKSLPPMAIAAMAIATNAGRAAWPAAALPADTR